VSLVEGIRGYVLFPDFDEEIPFTMAEVQERLGDIFWLAESRRPFTWNRFLRWWIYRRWLAPRDAMKEDRPDVRAVSM
jgi:hypothetical protein